MTILDYVRLANCVLGIVAICLIVPRSVSIEQTGRKRTARYYGYLGLIFWSLEGSAESAFQGSQTGMKTLLGFFVLAFIVYSEWEPPKK